MDKSYLEKVIDSVDYNGLNYLWKLDSLACFSESKTLFDYQTDALKNITKVLYLYFEAKESPEKSKFALGWKYGEKGCDLGNFNIKKYPKKSKAFIDKRFSFFQDHFRIEGLYPRETILTQNFINRACFWMATGSGKSLVLIKTIELLDHLQSQKLIPRKEIMLLLPREDLIKQFQKQVADFNNARESKRQIQLINLKKYDEYKRSFDFKDMIKVYYYRSDLIRTQRKENILDYKSYENNGDWYVFLDEAHRGKKEDSLMQDCVCVLSKNGFLFNFSATFTEAIDYATTCYNFNLEKFIEKGYGKNLYLSPSYFNFTKDKDDFSEREKQKQVLKSLIVLTLVKLSKKDNSYHVPLLITLVNSVNTQDSDLLLFFKKLEEIAHGNLEESLFNESKKEVIKDGKEHKKFVFGDEELALDEGDIKNLQIKDIFEQIFNAQSHGIIEILEGEKGKEIALKLQTSKKPFALIKIGDTKTFQKERLGSNYWVVSSFEKSRKYFENINLEQGQYINLLLGSRSFYEGWDSNRPNVINMINIGKRDAKKFVLQGIGRGIRIEPYKGYRKRLGSDDKNNLLETLFVFATDKDAVKAIVETVKELQNKDEVTIPLFENENKPFDLLIPVYKEKNTRKEIPKFHIAEESLERFKKYFKEFNKEVLFLKTGISKENLDLLTEKIKDGSLFETAEKNIFSDMKMLLNRIMLHTAVKNKFVEKVKEVEDEIIHFKHIKVNFTDEEIKFFKNKIQDIKNFKPETEEYLKEQVKSGKITIDEYTDRIKNLKNKDEEPFKDLKIKNIAQHYYLPLIYSEIEKVDYIRHIIKVKSEVAFIKNLENHLTKNEIKEEWMFSKIDESLDKFYIPYFYGDQNTYHKYFPDFIFWVKKENHYKIIFIDPKGTSHTDYQSKIEGFEKLFLENNQEKVFDYKTFKVTFYLKMVTDNVNKINEKYQKYWLGNTNFKFLKF